MFIRHSLTSSKINIWHLNINLINLQSKRSSQLPYSMAQLLNNTVFHAGAQQRVLPSRSHSPLRMYPDTSASFIWMSSSQPSNVQEPNFSSQRWMSNGNHLTSTLHVLTNIPWKAEQEKKVHSEGKVIFNSTKIIPRCNWGWGGTQLITFGAARWK